MTTKRERGRDPEQHVVHAGYAQANIYIGMHGQITGVADVDADDPKAIVELRFHDGITQGGHMVPLIPAVETPRSPLTFASVPPEFAVASGATLVIHHELRYRPLVQVLSAAGVVVAPTRLEAVDVVKNVAPPPTGATSTAAAGPASNTTNDHTHAAASVSIPNHTHGAAVAITERTYSLVNNFTITHHDDESLTVVNNSGAAVQVLLR